MKTKIIISILAIVSFISLQSFSQSKWKLDMAYNNFFERAKKNDPIICGDFIYRNSNRVYNGFSICPKYNITKRFTVLTGIDFLFNYTETNGYKNSTNNYLYKIGLPLQCTFDIIKLEQFRLYPKAGFSFKYRFDHVKYSGGGTYNSELSIDDIQYLLGYGLGCSFKLNDKLNIFIESTHNHDIGELGTKAYTFFDSKLGVSLSF